MWEGEKCVELTFIAIMCISPPPGVQPMLTDHRCYTATIHIDIPFLMWSQIFFIKVDSASKYIFSELMFKVYSQHYLIHYKILKEKLLLFTKNFQWDNCIPTLTMGQHNLQCWFCICSIFYPLFTLPELIFVFILHFYAHTYVCLFMWVCKRQPTDTRNIHVEEWAYALI